MPNENLHRYLLSNGSKNPAVDSRELSQTLHALYTHWVRAHCHRRDFREAVEHAASLIYIEYVMAGSPAPGDDAEVPPREVPLAAPGPQRQGPLLRFYDDDEQINREVDTTLHVPALASHFMRWLAAGFSARDFICLVRDLAAGIIMDDVTYESLAGLGGGMTREQFLQTPYGSAGRSV